MFSNRLIRAASALILSATAVIGCTTTAATANPQTDAINEIRSEFGLSDLPLEFVETSGMINSPDGNLQVALYKDSEGRKFSVEPETNQVVEIDARSILSSIPPDRPAMTQEDLKAIAERMVATTTPNFDARASGLIYEEGTKGDFHFFTWRDDEPMGAVNHPFAQIGLHVSGELFAYYNTLSIK